MSEVAPPADQVMLHEWQESWFPHLTLTDSDRQLCAELQAGEDTRLTVEEMRVGLRIKAYSWVGLVKFGRFEVLIIPKFAGFNAGLVRMIQFAAGLDSLRRESSRRTIDSTGMWLFDLLALLLTDECERILRTGILYDYVEREGELTVVRGRLLSDLQLLRRFGRVDRLICRFDEHERDIPDNQLLACALNACATKVRDAGVRRRIRILRAIFEEVCSTTELDLDTIRAGIVYNRQNERYRDAHILAGLLLDGLHVKDVLAPGRLSSFAFMIDMNVLFEMFVYRLIDQLCGRAQFRVHYQRRDSSIILNADTLRSYSRVVPDLLVETHAGPNGVRVAVDAKYKLYDVNKLQSGDIYQAFLYAYAYGQHGGVVPPTAVLVYPASSESEPETHLRIRNAHGFTGAELFAIGVFIPAVLEELGQGRRGPASQRILGVIQGALGAHVQIAG